MSTLLTLPGTILPTELPSFGPTLNVAPPDAQPSDPFLQKGIEGVKNELGWPGTKANANNPTLAQLTDWKSWIGARGVTLLIGLMLIAGTIFTHPTVLHVAKKTAETAAA